MDAIERIRIYVKVVGEIRREIGPGEFKDDFFNCKN